MLKFVLYNNSETKLLVTITDITGNQVFNEQFNTSKGVNAYQLNINDVAPGLYLFNIQSGNYSKTTKLMIEK